MTSPGLFSQSYPPLRRAPGVSPAMFWNGETTEIPGIEEVERYTSGSQAQSGKYHRGPHRNRDGRSRASSPNLRDLPPIRSRQRMSRRNPHRNEGIRVFRSFHNLRAHRHETVRKKVEDWQLGRGNSVLQPTQSARVPSGAKREVENTEASTRRCSDPEQGTQRLVATVDVLVLTPSQLPRSPQA